VEEFFGETLQNMRKQVGSQFGFEIVFARTEFGGYCSHCQALREQEKQETLEGSTLQTAGG
jgi:Fur family ferric uptake transcriptional regulator